MRTIMRASLVFLAILTLVATPFVASAKEPRLPLVDTFANISCRYVQGVYIVAYRANGVQYPPNTWVDIALIVTGPNAQPGEEGQAGVKQKITPSSEEYTRLKTSPSGRWSTSTYEDPGIPGTFELYVSANWPGGPYSNDSAVGYAIC